MALIKTRPKIRLLLPSEVQPGDRVTAEVVLEARRPIPVDFVAVRLSGSEHIRSSSANHVATRVLLVRQARLAGQTTLAAGTTRLPCSFELTPSAPASGVLPPSYAGTAVTVEYTIAVHASIPWWPDARKTFVVNVALPPAVRQADQRVYTTGTQGPSTREPHLEFTLENEVILPGDTLRGQIALYNVGFNRYRELALSLVGKERLHESKSEIEAHRYSATMTVQRAQEGEPFEFAMKLPSSLPPAFTGRSCSLAWSFEIEAKIAWGHSLKAAVRVELLPRGSERAPRPRYAAPSIGSPRIAALWEHTAHQHGLALDPLARRMVGRAGNTLVEIARAHRGADGIFLVATLRYPDLGLSIDGGVASGIRRVIGGGIELGDAAWDKAHYLTGREPAQIEAFCRHLRQPLLAARLADIDDEHLVIETRDAGQTPGALARFVELAQTLAGALPAARAAVPPPTLMAEAVPAWRELARELDGELDLVCMAVRGRYHEVGCAVATRWAPSGEALHTELALDTAQALLERHQLSWTESTLVSGHPGELPAAARALCDELVAGCVSLTLDRTRLVLWDPAPLMQARHALRRLAKLAALSALLRGAHGPYR